MPLLPDEKEQIRENRFHLDCLDMILTRRGDPNDTYRGAGFIRQSAEGKIEYRIYDRVRPDSFEMLGLQVGDSIPEEKFYDLEARDLRDRTWRATHTLPGSEGVFGLDGCICKGTVWQIICTVGASESSSKNELWMYLPGEFKLPTTAGTRLIREAPESSSYSFDLNLWEIKDDRYEFLLTKVANGLEVAVSPVYGSFPEHFNMRLEESLWFALAIPAKWSLLEEVNDGERRFTIRPSRDRSLHPRLRAPLEPNHGQPAIHLGKMFTQYLEYILPYAKHRYHPLSVAIYRNLRASALSLDAEALWLPVSIESVVQRGFKHLGHQEKAFLNTLDDAIIYVEQWMGEPTLKQRIIKVIKQWRGQNVRQALNQLVQKDVISEQQLAAWNRIRHRMAHGQEIGDMLGELSGLCDLTYMALLRLLFEVIGYSGPYTDRSAPGWPTVEYSIKGLGGEASS